MSISGEVRDSRARPPARHQRPVLLDRLPGSFVASPGFAAAAGGAAILYGLALSVVWTGVVKDRAAASKIVQTVPTPPVELPKPPVPTPDALAGTPQPAPPTPASVQPAPPVQTPSPIAATPTTAAQPTPSPATPAPATPGKAETQVALITTTQPAVPKVDKPADPPKPRQPDRDGSALGALIDPTGKAQLTRDAGDVTLKVPNKLCFLNPAVNIETSPRALTGMEGDFDLVVRVQGDSKGEMKPGADALKNAPLGPNGMPFSFNGAGLLVWRDAANFLRLERAVGTQNGRNFFPIVVLELWQDGKLAEDVGPEVPNGPLSLRVERRGNVLKCAYSLDGLEWKAIKEPKSNFAERVEVGILGSNTSKKPFVAKFEGFRIGPPPAK